MDLYVINAVVGFRLSGQVDRNHVNRLILIRFMAAFSLLHLCSYFYVVSRIMLREDLIGDKRMLFN